MIFNPCMSPIYYAVLPAWPTDLESISVKIFYSYSYMDDFFYPSILQLDEIIFLIHYLDDLWYSFYGHKACRIDDSAVFHCCIQQFVYTAPYAWFIMVRSLPHWWFCRICWCIYCRTPMIYWALHQWAEWMAILSFIFFNFVASVPLCNAQNVAVQIYGMPDDWISLLFSETYFLWDNDLMIAGSSLPFSTAGLQHLILAIGLAFESHQSDRF